MRSSVRGGSKVIRGTRRRRRRAEHEPPPPSGDGGHRAFSLVAPPPRPAPGVWSISRAGLVGAGALPLVYVRCCWPSYCSPVGHGIKALRGRLRRGSFRAPGALAWIRPLRPFGRFAALTPRPCRSGWRLRSGLQRGRSVQRIQHSGGGFYVGVGFCGSGVAWCAVVFGSFSVARWRGRGSVRRSGGGGALGCSFSLARVPVPPAGGGVPCGSGGVRALRGVSWGSALPGGVSCVAGSRLAVVSPISPSVPGHAVI